MKRLGTVIQVLVLALCMCAIWLLSGGQDAAFRYMGF